MNRQPTSIRLRKTSNVLELGYADGTCYTLPAELLRVYSPSAEVLQHGKRHVRMTGIEAVGHYAVQLTFDDGHNTGIYSWDYLYQLGTRQDELWQDYLDRLAKAGRLRDDAQVITIVDPAKTD